MLPFHPASDLIEVQPQPTTSTVQIPPLAKPLPLAPHRARFTQGLGFKGWLALAFIPLFAALAVLMAYRTLSLLVLPLVGTVSDGIIENATRHNSDSYEVFYSYQSNGHTFHNTGYVLAKSYENLHYKNVSATLTAPVRHFEIGPSSTAEFADIAVPNHLGSALFLSLFLTFITAALIKKGFLFRRHALHLAATGNVAGILIRVTSTTAIRYFPTYQATFEFVTSRGQRQSQHPVPAPFTKNTKPGTPLTILHQPANPQDALILESLNLEFV